MMLPREKRLQSLEQKVQETLKKPPPDPPPQLQVPLSLPFLLLTTLLKEGSLDIDVKMQGQDFRI